MLVKHIRFKSYAAGLAALILLTVALAAGKANAINQLVAQGYQSGSSLQAGMIVRLDPSHPNQVIALDLSHITGMLGVVITANEAALTLSQINTNEVYVSNYGQHDVLVTNQNGPISVGNYITVSSVAGLGTKASGNVTEVLGHAAGSFDGEHNVLSNTQVTNASGTKTRVSIGLIPVDINIAYNPLAVGAKGVPTFLNKITKFATNKYVSATRVYLSMLCVVAGLILTITIIYSGIKNGFISIGRNPLAKKAIVLNLVRVVIISLGIFVISLGAAYAIIAQ